MRRYTSEELFELAAGYALGATSNEETAAIDTALPQSPELAAEVASFREVAVQLAQSRAVAPPPLLRDKLLDRVRETQQTPYALPRDATVVPISSAPSAVRRRGVRPWAWVTAIAASLLLAAGLGLENLR